MATLQAVLKNTLKAIPHGMLYNQICILCTFIYLMYNFLVLLLFIIVYSTDLGGKKPTAQQRELKIIQSKSDIESPKVSIRSKQFQ